MPLSEEQRAHLVDAAPETRGLNFYFGAKGHDEKLSDMKSLGAIHLGFRLYQLRDIDVEHHSYFASFRMFYEWCDVNLARRLTDGTDVPKAEWLKHVPEVDFMNAIRTQCEEWKRSPRVLDVATGRMYLHRKYEGSFTEQFELTEFPFDVQNLKLQMQMKHKSFRAYSLRLLPFEFRDLPRLPGWSLLRPESVQWTRESALVRVKSDTTITLRVKRESGFYVSQIINLLTLLTSLGFISFVLPLGDVFSRVELCIALLFTIIALRFSVSVPTTDYATVLDRYQNECAWTLVLIALLHACISGAIVRVLTSGLRAGVSALAFVVPSHRAFPLNVSFRDAPEDFDALTSSDELLLGMADCVLGVLFLAYWLLFNVRFFYRWRYRHERTYRPEIIAPDENELLHWTATWSTEQRTQRPWSSASSLTPAPMLLSVDSSGSAILPWDATPTIADSKVPTAVFAEPAALTSTSGAMRRQRQRPPPTPAPTRLPMPSQPRTLNGGLESRSSRGPETRVHV